MRSARAPKWPVITASLMVPVAILLLSLALLAFVSRGQLATASLPQQLMALLEARSPGERVAGALTQSKKRIERSIARLPKKLIPALPTPTEQLAKVVVPATPPLQIVPPPEAPPVADIIAPALMLASLPPIAGSSLLNPAPGPVLFMPPPPPPPTLVNSAVPEPQSWLIMLIGFGMIGSAMQRRQRLALRPVLA